MEFHQPCAAGDIALIVLGQDVKAKSKDADKDRDEKTKQAEVRGTDLRRWQRSGRRIATCRLVFLAESVETRGGIALAPRPFDA